MLGLDRYAGQGVWIGEEIYVYVNRVGDRKVRLLFDVPANLSIKRDEFAGCKRLAKESPEAIAAKKRKKRREKQRRRRREAAALRKRVAEVPAAPLDVPIATASETVAHHVATLAEQRIDDAA